MLYLVQVKLEICRKAAGIPRQKYDRCFWTEESFFENWAEYIASIPFESKISTKSLYLQRLRR